MAWKKVEGTSTLSADVMWDFETNKAIEGAYIARKDNVGENQATILYIQGKSGQVAGIWANVVLINKFEAIEIGSKVRIEYLGRTASNKKGRSPYKNYEVFVDDEDAPATEEVASAAPASEDAPF